jgi:hypothetical protein
MQHNLYDSRHLREYLFYGLAAALLYIIPTWIFLYLANYSNVFFLYLGSILFMAVIGFYSFKLSRRRPEYESTWLMIVASQLTVVTGIIFAVILTFILGFVYIPGFMSGNSEDTFLKNAPDLYNHHNVGLIFTLFVCATIVNLGASGFISVLGPYVFKIDQTKDKSVINENEMTEAKLSGSGK